MIWAVIIGVIVLLLAIALQQWVTVVFEDDRHFLYIVGGFLVVFLGATALCFWLLPDVHGGANVGQLVQSWVDGSIGAKAEGPDDLPLLK
ncbi:MAG TPA: hypothetical protein VMU11_03295 [Verrucomicrobiae bacterium]|nr:hypothetical protein [Verrucomicrobiae bacterium]